MTNMVSITGKFRPLQDWVILKRKKKAEEKIGGILLPESATSHEYGPCEVVAVGPGTRGIFGALKATELKPGSVVLLQKFVEGDFKFTLNGEKVFACREQHLNVTLEA